MDTVQNGVGNAGSRKTVRTATSTAAKNFARKAAKKGVEDALKAGSEFAINKIDSLGNTAINRGVSPKLAHNVRIAVKRGARSGLSNLSNIALSKINTSTDNSLAPSQKKKINRNNKTVKKKLSFNDDGVGLKCRTSPIIFNIYPQNNPGKSTVEPLRKKFRVADDDDDDDDDGIPLSVLVEQALGDDE